MKTKLSIPWRILSYAAALAVLGAHFGLTFLHLLPPNPLKTITIVEKQYINGFFSQNWNLFAPNPSDLNLDVSVSCLTDSEQGTKPRNITSPLTKAHIQNRFSPLERVARVPENYAFMWMTRSNGAAVYDNTCQDDPNQPICKARDDAQKRSRETAVRGLTRVASAFCADVDGGTGRYTQAHLYIGMRSVPRWSKRFEAPSPEIHFDLGVQKLVPVQRYGIWEAP